MNLIKFILLGCLNFYIPITSNSQSITQQLRGTVLDHQTKHPLSDASILIKGSGVICISDSNGNFIFPKLALGKYDIGCSKIGFQNTQISGIELNSGKEVVLQIELEESISMLRTVIVNGLKNKNQTRNPFALIRTRQFGPQEAIRYAGGFQDPSRMALAFAGVTNAGSDDNNEIVIRGNSSRGLLWRLEGIEIPNPNHFSDGQGSTSGIVSMINANSLSSSDFMTGAFPANFGNGLSGVFDLNFRKGNDKKHELSTQLSLVGIDVEAEGPLGENGNSYRVAARNSTLEILLNTNIINLKTSNYSPNFKDLNFTFYFPTKKWGTISLWGLMGSDNTLETSLTEKNINNGTLQVYGVSHKVSLQKLFLKSVLSFSYQTQESIKQNVQAGLNGLITKSLQYNYPTMRFSTSMTYKFNSRLALESGIVGSDLSYKLKEDRLNSKNVLFNYLNDDGNSNFLQGYSQMLIKLTPNIKSTFGLHQYHFILNGASASEPRWSVQISNKWGGQFSTGMGWHSRLDPISVYFYKKYATNGTYTQPNKNIKPGTALHYIMSYEQKINEKTMVKVEAYLQEISKVPIDTALNGTYSLLNTSGGIPTNVLANAGFGKNKGIELTIERFYAKDFYYLITASLFDSKYQNKNTIWHNTIYNNGFAGNILIGKEYKMKKNNSISLNIRYIGRGGNKYTPINLSESIKKSTTILNNTQLYEAQYPNYWRLDFSISYKKNRAKSTWSYGADIQNVTDHQNIISKSYDNTNKSIKNSYALPRIPIIFVRCDF